MKQCVSRLIFLNFNLDEYDQRTTLEIKKCAHETKVLFQAAFFFLVASVAALFFDTPIVAGSFFLISWFFKDGASEARLKGNMIEANWWLAILIDKNAGELEAIRSHLKIETDQEDEEGDAET